MGYPPPHGGYPGPYGHGPPPPGYGPPGYGYGPPPPPKKSNTAAWIVVGVVGLFLVAGVAGAGKKGSRSVDRDDDRSTTKRDREETPDPKAADPEPPAKPTPDMKVTAVKLFQDYEANEVAADNVYKGKTLLVSGKVQSIDKDFMDNIVVHLTTPNEFMSALATVMDSEKAKAGKLTKGQTVSVLCSGGGRIIGSPVLRDCTIE